VEFRRSWIDLSAFKEKVVQIRFRLATDDSIILPNSAWYVDDVKISYDADCKDTLFMRLDRANYGPDETVQIRVFDPSLPSAASVNVTVTSEIETAGETVSLNKVDDNTYQGTVTTKNEGVSGSDGLISCTDGGTLTVVYSSSANGGSQNPDKAQAKAFYYLPSLFISPPLNEGVSKINNNVENALVFPLELSALGADIIMDSIKFAPTVDSDIDPLLHIAADGVKLYEDTNYDRAFNADDDELLGTVSLDAQGNAEFTGWYSNNMPGRT